MKQLLSSNPSKLEPSHPELSRACLLELPGEWLKDPQCSHSVGALEEAVMALYLAVSQQAVMRLQEGRIKLSNGTERSVLWLRGGSKPAFSGALATVRLGLSTAHTPLSQATSTLSSHLPSEGCQQGWALTCLFLLLQ